MANTYTSNVGLRKPEFGKVGWNAAVDANWDEIDARIFQFAVRGANLSPSTGFPADRTYTVSGGDYINQAGQHMSVASFPAATAPPSSTTYVWLKPNGTLGSGPALPTGGTHAPLARITTDATKIIPGGIKDMRTPVTFASGGGMRTSVKRIAADYAVVAGDTIILINNDVIPITVMLPQSGDVLGQHFTFVAEATYQPKVIRQISRYAECIHIHLH